MSYSIPRRQASRQIIAGAAALALPAVLGPRKSSAYEPREVERQDLIINADGPTADSKISLSVSPDGDAWAAWHAYHRGRDRIMARRIEPGPLGPTCLVSGKGSAHGSPVIVATENGAAWVFWSALEQDTWRLVARQFSGTTWQPIVEISGPSDAALLPAAARLSDGCVFVTWSEDRQGRSRIMARVWKHGTWGESEDVSMTESDAYRSAVAVGKDGVLVAWDAYREGRYEIWARPCLPEAGEARRVSPDSENCLLPATLATEHGIYVAWLQVTDVTGGEGVISQRYTLHAAIFRDGRWRPIRDTRGGTAGAELAHGLVEKIEPQPVATGGYQGRRRQAMLLADGNDVWLLWERKTDHEARTPDATGDLMGRPCRDGRWDETVILRQGYVDYRIDETAKPENGKLLLLASNLPREYRRIYHRLEGDLRQGRPVQEEPWTGWRPVRLPKRDPVPRHEIQVGGRKYRLYWGDLHCHSHLSVDAEGEPDELMHYARDKARLDVVVFTENDHMYNAWLTEGEFALGVYYANRFTREGRFVALPGFEWTSRIPKTPDIAVSDPRNWDPRYYGATSGDWAKTATGISYQNHRSVIYPPAGGPVVRHPEIGNDIGKLLDAVGRAGGVAHPHHDIWKLSGNPLEANVEVTSGWAEYFRDPTRIHAALNDGYRFGFLGNSDNHRRTPGLGGGLTGIYAESLTPQSILDALRHHRVFATSGSRIILDARANGALMGQETTSHNGQVDLQLKAVGTRPIVEAALVRDGQEIRKFLGDGTERLSVTFQDRALPAVAHWYYWRVTQEGHSPDYPGNVKVAEGPLAWSSPHWVVVR